MAAVPPAPSPHNVRATIKEPMLGATAHQATATASIVEAASTTGLLPMVSDRGANKGIKAVDVIRKDVDSQDAEFEEWNSDVMTG